MAPTTLNRHVADEAADDRPRAVLYARQSKLNEDGSDASPLMQWEAGEALCAARGYRVVKRFRDVGKSGWDPSVQRDGFDEMMDWVRGGKCDVVVIFTLSRLTRMGAQEAFAIEKVMRDNGVSLVSVREPYRPCCRQSRPSDRWCRSRRVLPWSGRRPVWLGDRLCCPAGPR
ncbi:recombinase family protein, partial [Streptomyces roseolus]|uniref:recombinase family protein n=1 Tax=Streptomyces roseolus TaxID=67358 RepID=UPI0036658D83